MTLTTRLSSVNRESSDRATKQKKRKEEINSISIQSSAINADTDLRVGHLNSIPCRSSYTFVIRNLSILYQPSDTEFSHPSFVCCAEKTFLSCFLFHISLSIFIKRAAAHRSTNPSKKVEIAILPVSRSHIFLSTPRRESQLRKIRLLSPTRARRVLLQKIRVVKNFAISQNKKKTSSSSLERESVSEPPTLR